MGDENVGWLNIPVNDALFVRRFHRIRNLDSQVKQQIYGKRPASDEVLEGLAIKKLHRDEVMAFMLVDIIDRANIRMI